MNPRHLRILAFFSAVLALIFSATPAQAHIVAGEAGGFAAGFKHPWSGWDHILAMVSVGIWGAQLGRPAIWVLPVTFPLVMSVGGFLGLIGVPLPGVEVGVALAALVLGVMIMFEAHPFLWIAAVIVGLFGLYHGHAHGTELPPGASGLLYSVGFILATGSLHLLGISIGLVHQWAPGRIALRVAGAAIAVAGCFLTWSAWS